MWNFAKHLATYIVQRIRALFSQNQSLNAPVYRPDNMSDETLAKRYYDAINDYAQAHMMYLYGSAQAPTNELETWRIYEQERIRRGYRTFPLDAFSTVASSRLTKERLMEKRGVRENAISYAENYTTYH